nr:serine hydrolase [Microbacterium testaceum]
MTRAEELRDTIAARIDETDFVAHGLHVRVGDDSATRRWTPDEREEIHSVAKAVAVLAVGIADDEGLVTLDTAVGDLLPTTRDLTLRHLLTMTSGIDFPYSETMMTAPPGLARDRGCHARGLGAHGQRRRRVPPLRPRGVGRPR